MTKSLITFGILFLALYVNATPTKSDDDDDDDARPTKSGDDDEKAAQNSADPFANDPFFKDSNFPKPPKFDFADLNIPSFKPLTEDDIKNIKAPENGSASGSFYSESSHQVIENGKVVEDEHKEKAIQNDNGDVKEYSTESSTN